MQKINRSSLARAFRCAAVVLVLGVGALVLAAPAQAGGGHGSGWWHGGGWHGGGWHGGGWGWRGGWGGWRGGWCCGWGWGPGWGWGWGGWWGPGVSVSLGWPGWGPGWGYSDPAPAAPAFPSYSSSAPVGMQPPAQSWYYCDNPRGFYPYVQSCHSAWRPVPVTPQGAPPAPQ